jgi:hypothetical protein
MVLRAAPSGTRLARAQALKTYFEFVEFYRYTVSAAARPVLVEGLASRSTLPK